jgi:hypothetical protein
VTDPQFVYHELLAGARSAPGHAYRQFLAPPDMVLRAFVDGVSRLPGLSLQAQAESVPTSMQLPKMKGAETSIRSDGQSQSRQVVYTIIASDSAYATVFIELASNLIAEISQLTSARDALLGVARRLDSWARFFDSRAREGLGRSAQLGLIGELTCLQRLAQQVGLSSAVRSWTGPAGTTHDFQSPRGAIEVKLSTTSAPERFRISSERQLDESMVPTLLLCAISAQEQPAGTGLSDLVDTIRADVQRNAPADLYLFDERLLQAGYSTADRPGYAVRITVRDIEFAVVREAFPRITPDDVRSGVFSVSYEIPRSAIISYAVPIATAGEIILGID